MLSTTTYPGIRKTSTQWHPQWALKVKEAQPNLITTWVYNGQPDPFNGGATAYCVTAKYGSSDNQPKLPDIAGMADFRGPSFHSARWDDSVDLRGKRFALVGAGASGFQIAPTIAE